jgi:hypothetical protein
VKWLKQAKKGKLMAPAPPELTLSTLSACIPEGLEAPVLAVAELPIA